MSSVTIVALAALLGAVLLIILAAMFWQESRRRPSSEPADFVIEDAADHVMRSLEESGHPVDRPTVLSVVEWHMQWVTEEVRAGRAGVIGLSTGATNYIRERQPDLADTDVERVLSGVSAYVASIGAVGPAF